MHTNHTRSLYILLSNIRNDYWHETVFENVDILGSTGGLLLSVGRSDKYFNL